LPWDQPYLETCCRSALHRAWLARADGRPEDGIDAGCLRRLRAMGLIAAEQAGRLIPSAAGLIRHAEEIARLRPDRR